MKKLDLIQPKTRDTPDDDPDGPGVPKVVPIGEEIQEYASISPEAAGTLASIRSKQHVIDSAVIGADVATLPPKVIYELYDHPLTDKGLKAFLDDWNDSGQKIL